MKGTQETTSFYQTPEPFSLLQLRRPHGSDTFTARKVMNGKEGPTTASLPRRCSSMDHRHPMQIYISAMGDVYSLS